MRILLINHYAGSPGMGMEFRPYYLARRWTAMGHRVLIVSAGYSHLRRHNPRPLRPYARRTVEGVDYLFVRTPPYRGNQIGRLKNVSAFLGGLAAAARPLVEQFAPSVVISSSTYPMDAFIARKIANNVGGIHLHEVHDLWPGSLMELYGYSAGHPAMVGLQIAEDYALSRADHVTSMLPGLGRYLAERGLEWQGFSCIPNGVEPDEPALPPPPAVVDTFWQARRQGRSTVLYLGGFGRANALEEFLQLAALRPEVLFVGVGEGPEKQALQLCAVARGISNLLLLPGVAHSRVYATLCLADVLYIGARPLKIYGYGVGMNKLYEYMASGRPVLSALGVADDPISLSGCGRCVPAGQPRVAARALDGLLALTPAERMELGKRGMDYVAAHHTYPVLAARYIKLMEDVAGEKKVVL
jgi:glycosyltransferase involved in cell wall biosynthesis